MAAELSLPAEPFAEEPSTAAAELRTSVQA
jgi:hypothetical protein